MRLAIALVGLVLPGLAQAQTPLKSSDDLQAALNAAQPGATILLEPGARFLGNYMLPKKPFGAAITIRSSGTLPARRITEADAPLLATIAPIGVDPAVKCEGGANWALDGIRFESNPLGFYDLIALDGCDTITMDRLLIVAGVNGQKRAIRANSTHVTLTRSHIANIWAPGQDSQAYCSWDSGAGHTITDNYLEAAGENVMFGGAASKSAETIPSDILVEGNHFSKRLDWKVTGHPSSVKNLFELKNAKRVTVRHNLFERNWTDSQNGFAILFTVRNDDNIAPWSTIEDVLFERNIIQDTEGGFNILGYDTDHPSERTTRITIRHNLVKASGTFLLIGGEAGIVTVDHVTSENGYNAIQLYAGGIRPTQENLPKLRAARYAVENLTVTNTRMVHNEYGVIGESSGIGTAALNGQVKTCAADGSCQPNWTWTNNALIGGAGKGTYPATTTVPATAAEVDAAIGASGDLGPPLDPTPQPPPDVCKSDPLVILPASIRWPSRNTGLRSVTFSTGSKPWTTFAFDWGTKTLTVSDSRSCSATVKRP